jgi:hypothetical protein
MVLMVIAVCEQDFWPKLKNHILPRIKAMLLAERPNADSDAEAAIRIENEPQAELDGILFKEDRIYRHRVLRINYTTYDVRRAQDTVNPNTARRDIMLLSNLQSQPDSCVHQYKYARVLGIFHVNVIYIGPGMLDYRARRMEFLWVRWYENIESSPVQDGWRDCRLDQLRFPPMDHPEAFGFVDPAHVIRAFHSIPRFVSGQQYQDGLGISRCSRDSNDWRIYFANR